MDTSNYLRLLINQSIVESGKSFVELCITNEMWSDESQETLTYTRLYICMYRKSVSACVFTYSSTTFQSSSHRHKSPSQCQDTSQSLMLRRHRKLSNT
uniref:Uncharacterized protein n=1 Tax=Trichobilharzia regenti TaxID=157069 RepID=A0AA85JQX0_TRIRE|nr:unnamed protein product [Trichobilharzia regenti]